MAAEKLIDEKGKTVVMLYDGIITFLEKARSSKGDTSKNYIKKAQDVISYLKESLDFEKGGLIASNLNSLYTFMIDHLQRANVLGEKEAIDDVIRILVKLKGAWEEVVERRATP